MSAFWSKCRTLLMIPERDPLDFPFVASDVAQLHRLCSDPAGASIDDATWNDLLLGPYCAELSKEVSIFGQHVLYQRVRAATPPPSRCTTPSIRYCRTPSP